jgi:polyisoprenyl-phosphate glycosyltransferase
MINSPSLRSYPQVTVAVPLFNEEQTVPVLLKAVSTVLDGLPMREGHEILCIDDGSDDRTLECLLAAQNSYPNLRIISLSRNFGHQAALSAALDHSVGHVVFVIDGDLQDDPAVLPRFIEEYLNGADVVYAKRASRPESLWRRGAYALHYRLLSALSEFPIPVDAGDFSLLSKKAVELIRALPERQRYLRGLRAWIGLNQVGLEVDRKGRVAGESKYSFGDLVALAFDGLLAFSVVPLRIATFAGILTVIGGLGYGVFVFINRLIGGPPQGFATLALLQILFSGMLLLILGVLGEYVGRIYEEVKGRPTYIIAHEFKPGHRNA